MSPFPLIQIAQVADEMRGSRLGDKRLDERAGGLLEMMAAQPSASFPEAARDEAELQAFYEFLRHDATGPGPVLAPHIEATVARIEQRDTSRIFVAHDTTELEVSDEFKPGLGPVSSEHGWGFFLHTSLVIDAEGPRVPLGLISAQMWRREFEDDDISEQDRHASKDPLPTMANEQLKWSRGVEATQELLGDETEVIHLMDRGADSYPLLARMVEANEQMVMRSNQNRRMTDDLDGVDRPKLEDAFEEAEIVSEREVSLGARDNTEGPPSVHPSREERETMLEIRVAKVSIRRPQATSAEYPESIEVDVVWAHEKNPPAGCEPIHWRLLTTQSVTSLEEADEPVDQYCVRWMAEELFGGLKGPFRPEERQLRSGQTYCTVVALMLPIVWRLLVLRTLAHHAPETPATNHLRESQLGVLAADSGTAFDDPRGVTVREALLGIAAMGGHLPRNGPPGWEVLHRGYQQLLLGEIRWIQGRQQLKRTLKQKWQATDDVDEFGQWLEALEMPESPLTYDQS